MPMDHETARKIIRPGRWMRKFYELGYYLVSSLKHGAGLFHKFYLFYIYLRWQCVDLFPGMIDWLPVRNRVDVYCNGRRVTLAVPRDVTFIFVFHEIFVCREYHLPMTETPRVIFDVGANLGLASIYFACIYPDADIYAFEPSEQNFRILERNTAAFPRVHVYNQAVYSSCGRMKLFCDPTHGGFNSFISQQDHFEDVETITIDAFARENGINRIDVLKIDVEGAEYEVLESCQMLARTGYIVGELHFNLVPRRKILPVLEKHFSVGLEFQNTDVRPLFYGRNRKLRSGGDSDDEPGPTMPECQGRDGA